MTRPELFDRYVRWLFRIVDHPRYFDVRSYTKLLETLHGKTFIFTNPMDENRALDGSVLRYHFGMDKGYSEYTIDDYLNVFDCTILEMMVALSQKCESMLERSEGGDRTAKWFAGMIKNLGLSDMTNDNFDEYFVQQKINVLLNRDYEKNGHGGLFTVYSAPRDMRKVEIWYQMCWFINEYLGG